MQANQIIPAVSGISSDAGIKSPGWGEGSTSRLEHKLLEALETTPIQDESILCTQLRETLSASSPTST
jgi:hypothetical protein